jgi:hypothetical protein
VSDDAQKISYVSSHHSFARTKIADGRQNEAKSLPCHVSAIKNDGKGDFYELTFDIANSVFTLPKVVIPQTFSKYTREPTQVGDKGYILPNHVSMSGSDGVDGSTASLYPRGNLATGAFQPVSSTKWDERDPNKYYHTGGPTGHMARSHDYSTYAHIDQFMNITHNAVQGIVHAAGNLASAASNITGLFPIQIPSGMRGIAHFAGNVLSGGTLPIPGGFSGIAHIAEQGIMHIADNALNSMIPSNLQGIAHIAENAISHTSVNGIITHSSLNNVINFVSKDAINMGAPPLATQYDLTVPPIPTLPIHLNVIGGMSASLNITAGGSISGSNMISGGQPVMTQPIPPQLINAPQIVNGDRMGNTALASLLGALVTLGLITDQTVDTGIPKPPP